MKSLNFVMRCTVTPWYSRAAEPRHDSGGVQHSTRIPYPGNFPLGRIAGVGGDGVGDDLGGYGYQLGCDRRVLHARRLIHEVVERLASCQGPPVTGFRWRGA